MRNPYSVRPFSGLADLLVFSSCRELRRVAATSVCGLQWLRRWRNASRVGFMLLLLGQFCLPSPVLAQIPHFNWATDYYSRSYLGPIGRQLHTSAVDKVGNTYITGYVSGTTTLGSTTLVGDIWGSTVFLAKLDNAGNFVWAIGSAGVPRPLIPDEVGTAVDVDSLGNVYVTGHFIGCMSFGGTSLCSQYGAGGIFVFKFNPNGGLIWAAQGGSTILTSSPVDMTLDRRGNIYIIGENDAARPGSVSTSMRFGSHTLSGQAGRLYVAKLSPRGQWLWAAGAEGDSGCSIAVDKESNAYVTGVFRGPTAQFGSTVLTGRVGLDQNIFVAKLDSAGRWLWAAQNRSRTSRGAGTAHGGWPDDGASIAVDGNGNAYIAGGSNTDIIETFGTHRTAQLGNASLPDGYVAKINGQGQWLWVKTLADALPTAITTDWLNNVFVAGIYEGASIQFGGSVLTYAPSGVSCK